MERPLGHISFMQTEPPSSAQESKPDVEPNMESPWNSLLDLEQFTEPLPTEPFEELVRRKIAVCHELLMQYQIRDRPLQGVQTHGEPSSVKSEPKPPTFERGVQTYTEMTTDVRTTGAISTAESTTQMAVPWAHLDSIVGMMMSSHILAEHALGIEDLAAITVYLHPLGRTAVVHLGLVLGLDYNRLRPLIDSPDFLTEMLAGWLQRVDQVQKAGVPTWRRLVEALRDPRVGQNAIASRIEQDRTTGVQTHGEPSSVKSEPKPPTFEQGVQTYTEMTMDIDVRTTEYLRGFESFAETSFVITGSHSHTFEWQGYGLKLHIPEGAMPAQHLQCRIDIKAGLSGQFFFPDGSQLVSCVYWLSCSQKFLKSVTLDIEHCASVHDSSQSSSLRFVVAKCSQAELPYQFKELKRGTFSPQSSYGSMQVSQFSLFGIVRSKMFSFHQNEEPRYYCSNLYYMRKGLNDWRVDFVIMWNLSGYREAVEKEYAGRASDDHLSLAVEFQKDTITLMVPVDGEVLENGWEITPLTPPTITKRQVDSFRPGQQLPSCCLSVEWTRDDNPVKLKHRISLVGAMEPFNFFYIKCIPENPLTGMEVLRKHSEKRRREQKEDHHNEIPKRAKLSSVPEIQAGGMSNEFSSEIGIQMSAQKDTKILAPHDLPFLMEQLRPVTSCWKFLGLLLRLTMGELNEIESMPLLIPSGPVAFLQETLNRWLKQAPPSHPFPTLTNLCDALRSCTVGESRVAYDLEQHYQAQRTAQEALPTPSH